MQIVKAVVKTTPKHKEIIHKNLHEIFNHIAENAKHAPLKGSRCVTKFKQHPTIGESGEWASEYGFLLILWIDFDLIITTILVKKAIKFMSGYPLKELVHEW